MVRVAAGGGGAVSVQRVIGRGSVHEDALGIEARGEPGGGRRECVGRADGSNMNSRVMWLHAR